MRLSKKILTKVIFLTALALNSSLLFAQNSIKIQKDKLPPLERLKTSRNNPIFEEYNRIVEDNYKTIKRNEEPEMLFLSTTLPRKIKPTCTGAIPS